MKKLPLTICAFAAAMLPGAVLADDIANPWLLRAGVANVQLSDKATLIVGGQQIPGAALHYHQIYTAMVEIGYTFADDWSAVATLGFPPHISAYGGGTVTPYGKFENTTFGPSAFTVQYQPFHDGWVRPYIGAGASYMIIFSTSDAFVKNAKLSNDLAPEVEFGSDFQVSDDYGLFIEAKKAFLQSNIGGLVTGYPLTGKADLSPWVFAFGATTHF